MVVHEKIKADLGPVVNLEKESLLILAADEDSLIDKFRKLSTWKN